MSLHEGKVVFHSIHFDIGWTGRRPVKVQPFMVDNERNIVR